MKDNHIHIFDTTLRDGAQTPKVGFSFWDRFVIAKAMQYVGVDVIEAGFPANTIEPGWISHIAKYVGTREHAQNDHVPVICALATLKKDAIYTAYESIKDADPDKRRIHVFIGTSKELQENSHGKGNEQTLEDIAQAVSYARELVGAEGEVQYSSEDAYRTERDFLVQTIQTAVDAGASHVNIPDTTGCALPHMVYEAFTDVIDRVDGIDDIVLATHNHFDNGFALANTMEAIRAGAREVQGTIGKLGERAGNTDLTPVIMNLVMDKDLYDGYFGGDIRHIHTEQLGALNDLIFSIIEEEIPLNREGYGRAQFMTSSGIHANAVQRDEKAYHIIDPTIIGREKEIVIGQTSGTATSAAFLAHYGYGTLDKHDLAVVKMTEAMNLYATEHSFLTDTEARLFAEYYIRGSHLKPQDRAITLVDFRSLNSKSGAAKVSLDLDVEGALYRGYGSGDGPIEAFMNAIERTLDLPTFELVDWRPKAVYHGFGAPGYEILDGIVFSGAEKQLLTERNGHTSMGRTAFAKTPVMIRDTRGNIYHGKALEADSENSQFEAIVSAFDAAYRLNPEMFCSDQK